MEKGKWEKTTAGDNITNKNDKIKCIYLREKDSFVMEDA
jgi:hypothetical protein